MACSPNDTDLPGYTIFCKLFDSELGLASQLFICYLWMLLMLAFTLLAACGFMERYNLFSLLDLFRRSVKPTPKEDPVEDIEAPQHSTRRSLRVHRRPLILPALHEEEEREAFKPGTRN